MKRYLLDTNIASYLMRGDMPRLRERFVLVSIHRVAISIISRAELMFGLAKRGYPPRLARKVRDFLADIETLPWMEEEADAYAALRAACNARGVTLSDMDMMIAAQAQAGGLILISRDKAFARIEGLEVEDWAA